jgi:hypothetical protein
MLQEARLTALRAIWLLSLWGAIQHHAWCMIFALAAIKHCRPRQGVM